MNETNIDVMCRLCLNNSFLHYNIFAGESTDSKPTYEIINYAYDLQISADDGLPEYICENCYAIVKTFKVYKSNAHKARSEIIRLKQNKYPLTEPSSNKPDGQETLAAVEDEPDQFMNPVRDAGKPNREAANEGEDNRFPDPESEAASGDVNSSREETATEEDAEQFPVNVKQEEDSLEGSPAHWPAYNEPIEYIEEGNATQKSDSGANYSYGKEESQLCIKQESEILESNSGYQQGGYASEDLHEPVCSIHVEEDSRTDMRYAEAGVNNSGLEYIGRNFPTGFQSTEASQLGKKRRKRSSAYNEIRLRDRGSHWPEFVEKRGRCVCCALSQIQSRPHSRCGLCKVYLCINEKKNCFYRYHYT